MHSSFSLKKTETRVTARVLKHDPNLVIINGILFPFFSLNFSCLLKKEGKNEEV